MCFSNVHDKEGLSKFHYVLNLEIFKYLKKQFNPANNCYLQNKKSTHFHHQNQIVINQILTLVDD